MTTRKSGQAKVKSEDPRRQPRQQRAHATVEAILEGAAKVLSTEGWRGFNTNSIATASGISVGSLYQYFANKDEIAIAVVDRRYQILKELLESRLENTGGGEPHETVVLILTLVVNAVHQDEGLYFILRQELTGVAAERLRQIFEDFVAFVALALALGSHKTRPELSERTAFIIVHAVDGVLAAAHRDKMSAVDSAEIVRELATLVVRYILP